MKTFDLENFNPDCMDENELADCIEQTAGNDDLFLIHLYLLHKIGAVRYRKSGFINLALESEERCEAVYNQLPKKMRW